MPEELSTLLANVESLAPGGKTDIYAPAIKGLELMLQIKLDKYVPAIILMTERYNHRVDLCSRLMVGVDICSHFLR